MLYDPVWDSQSLLKADITYCGTRETAIVEQASQLLPPWLTFVVNANESFELTVTASGLDDSMIGDYDIAFSVSLVDFPLVESITSNLRLSITCPLDRSLAPPAQVDIVGEMAQTVLEYDVTSL